MEAEIPPEDYDTKNYNTEDIKNDLELLLETFGPEDELVKEYQAELKRRREI